MSAVSPVLPGARGMGQPKEVANGPRAPHSGQEPCLPSYRDSQLLPPPGLPATACDKEMSTSSVSPGLAGDSKPEASGQERQAGPPAETACLQAALTWRWHSAAAGKFR